MISGHAVIYEVDFWFPGLRVIHRYRTDRMTYVVIDEWVNQILTGLLIYIDSIIHIRFFVFDEKTKSNDKKMRVDSIVGTSRGHASRMSTLHAFMLMAGRSSGGAKLS